MTMTEAMSQLRYYDTAAQRPTDSIPVAAAHSEFLRTGRISKAKQHWLPRERRYLSHEEVARTTGRKLEAAGDKTHERLNTFHRAISFPKMIFHRTLENRPHLGYCHVTASKANFKSAPDVNWAFYIANFSAEIGEQEPFFSSINSNTSRMYFAVAIQPEETGRMTISRAIRNTGLLFRTNDPKEALKNVLLLGARSEELRQFIRKI